MKNKVLKVLKKYELNSLITKVDKIEENINLFSLYTNNRRAKKI